MKINNHKVKEYTKPNQTAKKEPSAKTVNNQTAKISALSSGNVSKYEFLTGKDVLLEKDLLEKAATIKRFEYL